MAGLDAELGVVLRVEFDLRDAFAVAQVDEDNAAVITDGINPSGERDGRTEIGGSELGTMMGALHGHGLVVQKAKESPAPWGGANRFSANVKNLAGAQPKIRLCPVISAGFAKPIKCNTVGAISASRPPARILV